MSRHRKRGRARSRRPGDAEPRVPSPPCANGAPARRDAAPRATGATTSRDRAPKADDRPRAPWHPVPLAELCVLVGIICMIAGFVTGLDQDNGRLLLVTGLALGSLGGLDTAAREHFSGYRQHHTVLAGLPAIAAAAILYFAQAPWIAVVGAGVVVFVAALVALRRAWRRSTL